MAIQNPTTSTIDSFASLGLSIITIGLAIIAFSVPTMTSLNSEWKKEESYRQAVNEEMKHNKTVASNLINQWAKERKILLPPPYSTGSYEALVDAGALNTYNEKSSSKLITLYSILSLWQEIYNTSKADETHASDVLLDIHAKNVQFNILNYETDINYNDSTRQEIDLYRLITIFGAAILIIGIIIINGFLRMPIFIALRFIWMAIVRIVTFLLRLRRKFTPHHGE